MKKKRIMVLYGGRSAEHEVSLRSAASVIKHLDPDRYDVVPVAINKQGHWQLNDYSQLKLNATQSIALQETAVDVVLPPHRINGSEEIALLPLKAMDDIQNFDVVFPVLHGPLGEDGTIQGLFELVDVPYVGAGVAASAIAMDKDIAKRLVIAAGLPAVPYFAVKLGEWKKDPKAICDQATQKLGCPLFVKPANLGSSVGIHKVKTPDTLAAAIDDAFRYDVKVLIEKAISAQEIELSVLENIEMGAPPLVSIPGEIIPSHEFYSYEAKYLDENGAEIVIPAHLNEKQVTQAQRLAAQIFMALGCEGMARVDLFLEKTTGSFYFNELNTIPGFTKISLYPKLWEASGIPYRELLSRLIELAIARHQHKRQLKRDRNE